MLVSMMLCMEANAQNTTVHVNMNGLADGTKLSIALAGTYEDEPDLQVVETKEGKATFSWDATEPRGYRIGVVDTYGGTIVAIGSGEHVTLDADVHLDPAGDGKMAMGFNRLEVKGSPTHDYYLAHRPNRNALNAEYAKYHEDNKEVVDKLSKAQRGTSEWDAIMASPEYQKLAEAEKAFFNKVEKTIGDAITENKDNWFGPFFMVTNYNYLTPQQRPVYDQFSDEVKKSFYGKVVADKVVPVSTDVPMPNFEFTDHATGAKMNLYDICKQNKYVLLDFWASWCGPCRKEIPNFESQYEIYKDKGFQIVSISADQKEADWLKALDEEKTPWPNDIDGDKGIAKLYKVQFYPTVYLLDKDARVIVSNNDARGENLRTKLAELFK